MKSEGIGVLLGVPSKKSKEPVEDVDSEAGESKHSEVKLAAADALMSAFDARDADAFCEAMDAYLGG